MVEPFQGRPGTSAMFQGLSLNCPLVPVSMTLMASARNGSSSILMLLLRSTKRWIAVTPPALESRLPTMKERKNVPYGPGRTVGSAANCSPFAGEG